MSRLDTVRRAINFEYPAYIPLLYFNGDRNDSDIIMIDVEHHFGGTGENRSEWGFVWNRADNTMGQPDAPVLTTRSELGSYRSPDADSPGRLESAHSEFERYGVDRYYLASLGLSGFTIMSFLWGFSRLMEDLILEPATISDLADIVFHTEMKIIEKAASLPFNGIAFFDDWGTQSGMIMSPGLWREHFKERYRLQFQLCHAHHLDVYFHSCGFYQPIIEDLIEIGVDMFNLSQPNVYDISTLGVEFRGRVCFVCPVSYQTTSISGSCEDIQRSVVELADAFALCSGGFIGYVEEYESIGMSDENYRCCVDAFRNLRPNETRR